MSGRVQMHWNAFRLAAVPNHISAEELERWRLMFFAGWHACMVWEEHLAGSDATEEQQCVALDLAMKETGEALESSPILRNTVLARFGLPTQ